MIENFEINNEEDVTREGLTLAKLAQPFKLLCPSNTCAIAKLPLFESINLRILERSRGPIKGIILDIDETVAPHHGEITQQNMDLIKEWVIEGRKIVIFSNMKKSQRYAELEALGIKVITSRFSKPDARGFEECLAAMGLKAHEAIMIGDNFITDGGAVPAGIDFVKVEPVKTEESTLDVLKRAPQTSSRAVANIISLIHDKLTGREVLNEMDML